MTDDYTPTTEEVREAFSEMSSWDMSADETDAAFDRWIAALRAEWEAEQGEVEWEYGSEGAEGTLDSDPRPLTDDKPYWPQSIPAGVHEPDAEQAAQIVASWNEGDPGSAHLIRRRKAGPWKPVDENEATDRENGSER